MCTGWMNPDFSRMFGGRGNNILSGPLCGASIPVAILWDVRTSAMFDLGTDCRPYNF